MNGMPTVAVADLVVHPRDHDLIAGTHGRSAYVMDIGPLQQMTDEVLAKDLHVFALENAVAFRYHVHSDDQFLGEKRFIADNPAFGATITYYVGTPPEDENAEAKIVIANSMGERVRELEARVAEDRASVTELTDTTLPELEERLDDNGIARVRVPSKDP